MSTRARPTAPVAPLWIVSGAFWLTVVAVAAARREWILPAARVARVDAPSDPYLSFAT